MLVAGLGERRLSFAVDGSAESEFGRLKNARSSSQGYVDVRWSSRRLTLGFVLVIPSGLAAASFFISEMRP